MLGNRKNTAKRGSSDIKPLYSATSDTLIISRSHLLVNKNRTNVYIFFTNNADKRREKTPASSFNG